MSAATPIGSPLLVAALLLIDRDTALLTSTAAIPSPAYSGPVAVVLRNREVVFTGLACGLGGLGVANELCLGLFAALGQPTLPDGGTRPLRPAPFATPLRNHAGSAMFRPLPG